jgi:hypothetical protein
VLHIDNRPAARWRFVERLVELADVRLAVVSPFAFGIGMVDDENGTLLQAFTSRIKREIFRFGEFFHTRMKSHAPRE